MKFAFLLCWVSALAASAARAVEAAPQFEQQDIVGTTAQFTSTVGTSAVSIPASAGNVITEVWVRCADQVPLSRKLSVSFDGGTTFFTLAVGESIGWSLKGGRRQIQVKGSVASVAYEIVMNRDDY